MIQEKDFLYRVPVKTAPITTPRGQIRNPEILVDLEGGEFMHGNILDANSTNKLINQSVKDAVDDKLNESGYVTKDLLDAETSARTKGDEDLSAKIKAEQTRAEGKEKEISDKLAIVDGDSNTEGSFRKAIADVIAAAPEDLDTLKEIADKLAGNDDLHTALNQAITEKADASALANEVARATGAESGLQAAIATKADAAALSNYVLTTALNQQVDALNTAISAKQDKPDDGNMFLQVKHDTDSGWFKREGQLKFTHDDEDSYYTSISPSGIYCYADNSSINYLRISSDGIELDGGQSVSGYAFTTNGKTAYIPTRTSELTNDSNFITAADVDFTPYATIINLKGTESMLNTKIDENTTALEQKQDKGNYIEYSSKDNDGYTIDCEFNTSEPITVDGGTGYLTYVTQSGIETHDSSGRQSNLTVTSLSIASSPTTRTTYTINGITTTQYKNCLATSDGTFKPISDFVLKEDANEEYVRPEDFENLNQAFSGLSHKVSSKQDTITANNVDITNLETADITQLRAIVKDLLNALSASGLIREEETLE